MDLYNPVKLTTENIEQALSCIGISYSPARTYFGYCNAGEQEKWFCDLELIIRTGNGKNKTAWECLIGTSIEATPPIKDKKKYILSIHPHDNKEIEWLETLPDKIMTDEKATEHLQRGIKTLIEVIANKGIYWSRKDEDWKIGGRHKGNVYFKPTRPRGLRRSNEPEPSDWKILRDPTAQ